MATQSLRIIKSGPWRGIITIMPFRNGPEKSSVKYRHKRDDIPVETRKKPRLIKRSGGERKKEDISLSHPAPRGGSHPLPFVNTRDKLYTPYYYIFEASPLVKEDGEDAEGEARGRVRSRVILL